MSADFGSIGFGTLSSLGVGSNLNTSGIVDSLMKLERIPLDRLLAQKTGLDGRISALGTIKSSLSSFQASFSGLISGSSILGNTATSSNTAAIGAAGTSGAIAGNYSLEVSQLAQPQKLVAAGQADATAAIGGGTSTTLTIDLGTISGGTLDPVTGTYSGATFTANANPSFNVVIDNTNNSLEGIRDAINAADGGVTATIINDGNATNPNRLVLSSAASGLSESIRIAVVGDATLDGLLAQDPAGTQNFSQTVTAQNALFTVDGINITKSSNTVTDVIQGVTLTLAGVTTAPVTVAVSQDTASAKTAVETFVTAYNDLQAEIKKQIDSGVNGGTAGALASDSSTRQMLSSIRDELNKMPTGITGSYTNLSSIGVSFQLDGTLALDETVLAAAIQDDSNNVAELFSSADGYAARLDTVVSAMLDYNGSIDLRTNAFKDRISTLEDRQENLESALIRTEARMRARFTALDVLLSSMTTTTNALSQQLASLNGISGNG
jgi:flagellar hook-associated protein 2